MINKTIMDEPIIDYISLKVIEDIRKQRFFEDSVSESLNKSPLIDKLREVIQPMDIPILMEMVKSSSTVSGNLAIGLLQKFEITEEVRSFFLETWYQSTVFKRKMALIWRILGDVNLDVNIHQNIYEFVINNLEAFINDSAKWCGGADRVLPFCKARLADPLFPRTKDWLYLCIVLGSSERESAIKLIAGYESIKDEFVAKVAKDLLGRMDG